MSDLKKYTTEQLYAELARRDFDKRALEVMHHKAGPYTVKDVKVIYGDTMYHGDNTCYFMFYIVENGNEHDFYYGSPPNLPEGSEQYELMYDFIPDGFSEAMENCYEFRDGIKAAIERLKLCGITNIEKFNPHG